MAEPRSYEDPCGLARALDRVGERWALLVIRELILGPKRFTDLRTGLPTVSPNVLSQRLRELEANGVIERRRLGPPVSNWAYALTPWGRELRPILLALGRWGSQATPVPAGPLSPDALMLALYVTFDPQAAAQVEGRLAIHFEDHSYLATVSRGQLEVERALATESDAVITARSGQQLRQALFAATESERRRAIAAGIEIEGDRRLGERFLSMFRRNAPPAKPGRG